MSGRRRSVRGVTLAELVVMASIVAMLTGMLMPAFARAKEKSLRAACASNLYQISCALRQYQEDYADWPSWLSCLYPKYIRDESVFICPADSSFGRDGCVPNRSPFTEAGAPQYTEADDTPSCTAADEVKALRNPKVKACSYLYDFNPAECSWWTGGSYPDANADGVVTWREVRTLVDMQGLQPNGKRSAKCAHRGHVPVVRCFHHVVKRFDGTAPVLNLAVEDRNVYVSGPFKDDWKACAQTPK